MMRKLFLMAMIAMVMLCGCRQINTNNQIVNHDYTSGSGEINSETGSTGDVIAPSQNEKPSDNNIKPSESETGDKFAYKIQDGVIMDFDSVKGPYYIFNIADNKVELLDCTNKSGKIVDYSFDGNVLTLVLYSNENASNQKYVIDTSVKSVGTLPMS